MTPYILLILSLVVLPAVYYLLFRHMDRVVHNPPMKEFFFLFGAVGGYLLLCAVLRPAPASLLIYVPFLLISWIALAAGCCTALAAKPRTRYHLAAAGLSVFFLAAPWLAAAFFFG